MRRFRSSILLFVALFLAASGCRTYGEYDSEEATYQQMQRLVQQFDQDLTRARADLEALQKASRANPYLSVLAAHYSQVVAGQEAVLDEHRDLLAELSSESTYRALNRAFGAMISEQRTIRLQREGLLSYVHDAYTADTTATGDRDRPYSMIPPYYARVTEAQRNVTMNEVLRLASMRAPSPGFALTPPDTSTVLGSEPDAFGGDDHGSAAHEAGH